MHETLDYVCLEQSEVLPNITEPAVRENGTPHNRFDIVFFTSDGSDGCRKMKNPLPAGYPNLCMAG